jgi:hypothetical protein
MPRTRAAIAIGVNKTGGLQTLTSPAENAEEFGTWLREEGFCSVVVFNDKSGAFLAKDCGISDACCSLPTNKQQDGVRGSVIFPNDDVQRQSRAKARVSL